MNIYNFLIPLLSVPIPWNTCAILEMYEEVSTESDNEECDDYEDEIDRIQFRTDESYTEEEFDVPKPDIYIYLP